MLKSSPKYVYFLTSITSNQQTAKPHRNFCSSIPSCLIFILNYDFLLIYYSFGWYSVCRVLVFLRPVLHAYTGPICSITCSVPMAQWCSMSTWYVLTLLWVFIRSWRKLSPFTQALPTTPDAAHYYRKAPIINKNKCSVGEVAILRLPWALNSIVGELKNSDPLQLSCGKTQRQTELQTIWRQLIQSWPRLWK